MNIARKIKQYAWTGILAVLMVLSPVMMVPLIAQKKKPTTNPPKTPGFATLLRGRRVFVTNCAQCHGGRGTGDGALGRGLRPPPANLTRSKMTRSAKIRIVSGGGISVGRSSGMPSWKSALTKQQIRDVVNYLMAIAPGGSKKKK